MKVFHELRKREGQGYCWDVLERMAKLSSVGSEEIQSLKRVSCWSKEELDEFMPVLGLYELYQTLDAKSAQSSSKLAKGIKLAMTNVLFNKLSRCDPSALVNACPKIIAQEVSLRGVIDSCTQTQNIVQVFRVLQLIRN